MWSMIVINEIPDFDEDRLSGKMNLVARFGRKTGVVLYQAGLFCAFGTLGVGALRDGSAAGDSWGLRHCRLRYDR